MTLPSCLENLAARQREDGAFLAVEGGEARPDATSWASLALRSGGAPMAASLEKARRQLLSLQFPDGRLPVTPRHPAACWPTTLAALAWCGWPAGGAAADRALAFLGNVTVTTFRQEDTVNAIDSTLKGWSWVAGTTCWVEPTALAVFAFDRYGRHSDRAAQGGKLLLDRQLPHGGWNFGNTFVYETELLPSEEYVGVALTALAGRCEISAIARSIAFIEERLPRLRTPLALSWAVLGLAAWGRRPADADQRLVECFNRQKSLGPFSTQHLALLSLATHCGNGLAGLFTETPA